MKVRVKTEFKDKYTGKLYRSGETLDMSVERINEVLTVGNFIELMSEPVESKQEETESDEQSQNDSDQEENEDAGETPKQTGRRKRSK